MIISTISPAFFRRFGLPILKREVETVTDNIFHEELELFIDAMEPEGLFLWVATENEQEKLAVMERLLRR